MSVLKEIGMEDERSTDRLWWCMAGLVGLISLWLPQLLQAEPARVTQVVISESALFFTGALIGCLRPDRVWRWGAASLVAVALRMWHCWRWIPGWRASVTRRSVSICLPTRRCT